MAPSLLCSEITYSAESLIEVPCQSRKVLASTCRRQHCDLLLMCGIVLETEQG